MIAVTFALPTESSGFLALLESKRRGAPGSQTVSGTLHGHAISVLHTGVGEKITRTRLAAFLPAVTPRLLISAGFAGALHDRLAVGDLLLAENYSAPDLIATAQSQIACTMGRLATTSAMIDTSLARQTLARNEGADAVDMETSFIAEACAAAAIPMLSLRAISDTPARPFPAPPHLLFDLETQRTPALRLAGYLVRHPAAFLDLMNFAKQISAARAHSDGSAGETLHALTAKPPPAPRARARR